MTTYIELPEHQATILMNYLRRHEGDIDFGIDDFEDLKYLFYAVMQRYPCQFEKRKRRSEMIANQDGNSE